MYVDVVAGERPQKPKVQKCRFVEPSKRMRTTNTHSEPTKEKSIGALDHCPDSAEVEFTLTLHSGALRKEPYWSDCANVR